MIKYNDFIQILQQLLQSFDGSQIEEEKGLPNPKNIYLLDKIQTRIKDKKFVSPEESSNGLLLKFKNNRNQFLIKKADITKTDPPLYFKDGNKWELDFKTSSVVLLTDFAFYLYQNAVHKLLQSDLKKMDVLKEHFTILCKDVDCFSELWKHKKTDCFALADKVEEKIYFVANSAEVIYKLSELFPGAAPAKKAKKEKQAFASDFLMDAYIENEDLHGKVKVDEQIQAVDVVFESEEETDFSVETKFFKRFIGKFTEQKQEQLLGKIAKEITDAAFNQSDKVKDRQKAVDDLQKDLRIVQFTVIEKDVLMILKSQQLFPSKEITVQLDEKLDIVDITIPESAMG